MTISLKPINVYQEFDVYDVDVDNRPLLDIQDNISEIANLLGDLGFYSEILADPSQEPAGGFTPFTCACVYSNNLLLPIDISKSTFIIDYATYPIVLILGAKDSTTKAYPCLFFSAGITLANKFASFVPNSQGRLLRVGPGGELVDQLYFDLAHASKGYQALYVGKILGPTSIVFGGNQVSILGNNFYLAKNRDDLTSGLITVQRSNADSNTVFKAVNINETGSTYNYAEYINSSVLSSSSPAAPSPIYFSTTQLPFNQASGSFVTQSLESSLNEIHFNTPSVGVYNSDQRYLTAGINVRGLFDFASVNLLHAPAYSNNVFETGQGISTKLYFLDRPKTLSTDPDIPIGIQYNSPVISVGSAISTATNQPANIIPAVDTTGITISDYFNTSGGYIGGIQDNGGKDSNGNITRTITSAIDAANQAAAGFMASGVINNATKTFINNGINDYANSFTLLISSKSSTTIASNIAISTDGYLNLSSVKGTLVNKMPILDTEITPKIYVDNAVHNVSISASNKIALTGTIDPTDATIKTPVTGIIAFDVTANSNSLSQVLSFNSNNSADILSTYPISFLGSDGVTPQRVFAETAAYPDSHMTDTNRLELVNKDFLSAYVSSTFAGAAYVSLAGTDSGPISSNKTVTGLFTFQNNTSGGITTPNLQLLNTSSGLPLNISVDSNNFLTIYNTKPVLLNISTLDSDPDTAIVTNKYLKDSITAIGPNYKYTAGPGLDHGWHNSPALPGVANYGYSILGDIVMFWCETTPKAFPNSGADSGDPWNPEFNVSLPGGLFSSLFTVQAQINDLNTGNRAGDDVWAQVINFDPNDPTTVKIKYEGASGVWANPAGYSTLLYIVGKLGGITLI